MMDFILVTVDFILKMMVLVLVAPFLLAAVFVAMSELLFLAVGRQGAAPTLKNE